MSVQVKTQSFLARDRSARVSIAVLVALSVAVGCATPVKRRVGETFDIGTVSYTVKGKEVHGQIRFGGSTIEAGRRASFIIISYMVANHGKDYISVNPLNLRLVTADQTEYEVDLAATYAVRMEREFENSGPAGSGTLPAGGSGLYSVAFRVPDEVARQKFNVVIRRRAIVAID